MSVCNKKTALVDQIKSDIINVHFMPGSALKLTILKEKYRVGATPIREALFSLVSTGLVDEVPNCGFRVHAVSHEELVDLYQSRLFLEKTMIELASTRPNPDWEVQMTTAFYTLDKLEKSPDKGVDYDLQWEKAHQTFHHLIVSNCSLLALNDFWTELYLKTERYRKLWLKHVNGKQFDHSHEVHEHIFAASINYNCQQVFTLLKQHYDEFLARLLSRHEH